MTARLILVSSLSLVFATGLLMVFGTSSALVLDRSLRISTHGALIRHLSHALLAVGACGLSWRVGYSRWLRAAPYLYGATLFLLVIVLLGPARNGAHRWLAFGPISFQPSELAKLTIPLFAVSQIHWSRRLRGFLLLFSLLALPLGLIFLEPDNGTIAIVGATLLALCFFARVRTAFWLVPTAVAALVLCWAALQLPYVSGRLGVYLDPSLDRLGKGHQPYQAKIAAGSGGLTGRGMGHSMQKYTYLPEAQNDYIAAIFAEEAGFVGMLLLIVLYMSVGAAGFAIAHRAQDRQGFWVAGTLTFLLLIQAFFNLGVVSGLLPAKGLNLPFFSQGGTSLIANGLLVGLLLSVEWRRES